ncbi:MAG: hydantoinase/oxoprolinase family protein [Burkholderiales bacterium]
MSKLRTPDNAVIGWDVGGAHLKAALIDGGVRKVLQLPCPLWRGLTHLERAFAQALREFGPLRARHALTMTGELADIFPDRAAGVLAIVRLAQKKMPKLQIYAGRKGFVNAARAGKLPQHVASANWLASAAYAATQIGEALLVDIGSTTADFVLLKNGKAHARGYHDHPRLAHDELVYSGVVRTPVMALLSRAPFGGRPVSVMAEHFATLADVYRITGELPQTADQWPAADGGAKTVSGSARRLARMIGLDKEAAPLADWKKFAAAIAETQTQRFLEACTRQLARAIIGENAPLIGAGTGSFVVRKLARRLKRRYLDFSSLVPSNARDKQWVNACAPAVAVALLAQQEND